MKKLLILVFILIGWSSFSQDFKDREGKYNWENDQKFSSDIIAPNLSGTGNFLKITNEGVLQKISILSGTTITIDSVIGLQDSLNLKQYIFTADSNFVFTNRFLKLNDSIWTSFGKFNNIITKDLEVVKSGVALLDVSTTDSLTDSGIRIGGMSTGSRGTYISFLSDDVNTIYSARVVRNAGIDNNLSINNKGLGSITLKTNAGNAAEKTNIRAKYNGAVIINKAYQLPMADGSVNEFIVTDGSDSLYFTDAENAFTAGSGITLSGNTISATGGNSYWSNSGNYTYNVNDSIGIGTATPSYKFHVFGQSIITATSTRTLSLTNTGANTLLYLPALNGTGIDVTSSAGNVNTMKINNYSIDSVSNDVFLKDADENDLVTEYAVKKYVDAFYKDTVIEVGWSELESLRTDSVILIEKRGANTFFDINRIVVYKESGTAYTNIADSCVLAVRHQQSPSFLLDGDYICNLVSTIVPANADASNILGADAYVGTFIPHSSGGNGGNSTDINNGSDGMKINSDLVLKNLATVTASNTAIECAGENCPSLKIRIAFKVIDITE